MSFEADYTQWLKTAGKLRWQSPSNIALVKYWGKTGFQMPANPSLSFTLKNCFTDTQLEWSPRKEKAAQLALFLDGNRNEKFEQKVAKFLRHIQEYLPFLPDFDLNIHTTNSFPHSSGIASSASGMSALALNLCGMEAHVAGTADAGPAFLQKASFLARIGSGSACRSIYGGLVSWGKHPDLPASSDLFGSPYTTNVHPVFHDLRDAVLLVHAGEKSVSSTVGHDLMHRNPFSSKRFEVAHENISELLPLLASGDQHAFGELIEREALMLHALMMTSQPYFLLFKPESVAVIEKIWAFRKQTGLPVYFTLDAGANVHLIYFGADHETVKSFIDSNLVVHCSEKGYICDEIGSGPQLITI
jgi:diphosphomevalonate decarboxylase